MSLVTAPISVWSSIIERVLNLSEPIACDLIEVWEAIAFDICDCFIGFIKADGLGCHEEGSECECESHVKLFSVLIFDYIFSEARPLNMIQAQNT